MPKLPEKKKAELLKAATHVFAQKGYRGASIRAIAKRAHADEGSIYRLFGSKQKLYWAVLKTKLETTGELVSSRAESSPEEVLAAWTEASLADMSAMRLLHFAVLEATPESRKRLKPPLTQLYAPLAGYVEGLKERGIIRRQLPTWAAVLALASLEAGSVLLELLGADGPAKDEQAAWPAMYAQIWLRGVCEETHGASQQSGSGHTSEEADTAATVGHAHNHHCNGRNQG